MSESMLEIIYKTNNTNPDTPHENQKIDEETGIGVKALQEEKARTGAKDLLPTAEEQPNELLVDEAYTKLAEIFFTQYQNALFEAGKYIIDNSTFRVRESATKKQFNTMK